ncbi:MAG: DsrE/DsrF/TusD sulfur relay family protein [Candidatus Kapaibacterium sp.]
MTQKILIIINDAPYGTEKAYNALRMAMTLQKEHKEEVEINIFLLADGVFCGLPNQNTPTGYYNIERMLNSVINKGGQIKSCGGCSQARGIDSLKFIEGVELSNMKEFAQWTVECHKVLTF